MYAQVAAISSFTSSTTSSSPSSLLPPSSPPSPFSTFMLLYRYAWSLSTSLVPGGCAVSALLIARKLLWLLPRHVWTQLSGTDLTTSLVNDTCPWLPITLQTQAWYCRKMMTELQISLTNYDYNHGQYERDRPYLFLLLNQTSLIESLAIPACLSTLGLYAPTFLNYEYGLLPIIGWNCALLDGVIIVRDWTEQAKGGVEKAVQRMQTYNESFYMSIEGRRSEDGSLSPFKKGPSVMAIQAQATIIPIFIHGARDILPFNSWRVTPGHISMCFLPPIVTKGMTIDDRHVLTKRLRALAESEQESPSFARMGNAIKTDVIVPPARSASFQAKL